MSCKIRYSLPKTKTLTGNHYLFKSLLNGWNGKELYNQEYRQLLKQIREVLDIKYGLAQTSQGNPEDWEYRKQLEGEVKLLGKSIKNALGLCD